MLEHAYAEYNDPIYSPIHITRYFYSIYLGLKFGQGRYPELLAKLCNIASPWFLVVTPYVALNVYF